MYKYIIFFGVMSWGQGIENRGLGLSGSVSLRGEGLLFLVRGL